MLGIRAFSCVAILGLSFAIPRAVQTTHLWPHIRDFRTSFELTDPKAMFVEFPVLQQNGALAYRVQCASAFATDARMIQFVWSGDFECRVFVPGATRMPDVQLLATRSDDRPLDTRGRFFWNQLTPACIGYPDWGGRRVFRFRNMKLTIQISDPKIVEPQSFIDTTKSGIPLQALRLEITGEFDKTATRSVAGLASYKRPPPVDPKVPHGPLRCDSPA